MEEIDFAPTARELQKIRSEITKTKQRIQENQSRLRLQRSRLKQLIEDEDRVSTTLRDEIRAKRQNDRLESIKARRLAVWILTVNGDGWILNKGMLKVNILPVSKAEWTSTSKTWKIRYCRETVGQLTLKDDTYQCDIPGIKPSPKTKIREMLREIADEAKRMKRE